MRKHILFLLFPLAGACYGVPVESNLQIEVTPRKTPALADGQGLADVRVTPSEADALFRRLITIQASSGRFLVPGGPTEGPPVIARLAPMEGPIELVLQYGRQPGLLVIEALREEALASGGLELMPRGPDRIDVDVSPRRLIADGRDLGTVKVQLSALGGAEISLGTTVHLSVCCEADGMLEPCEGESPLRVPATLTLTDASTPLETQATTGYIVRTSTVIEDFRVWLRAAEVADVPCVESTDEVSAAVALTLTPVDG